MSTEIRIALQDLKQGDRFRTLATKIVGVVRGLPGDDHVYVELFVNGEQEFKELRSILMVQKLPRRHVDP